MLDDLRERGADLAAEEVEEEPLVTELGPDPNIILGMTPAQRFVIAVMLLMSTCLISTFCLLVTEKISLPLMF